MLGKNDPKTCFDLLPKFPKTEVYVMYTILTSCRYNKPKKGGAVSTYVVQFLKSKNMVKVPK